VRTCHKLVVPALGVVLALLLLMPARPAAHEIPNDARVQMLVRPSGQLLRILIRVPMASTADAVRWPTIGAGYLDVANADSTMRDASQLFLVDYLTIYEDGRQLPPPTIAAVMASLPSDTSFASFDQALAHVTGPKLQNETEFAIAQGFLDVLFDYPIQSDRSRFSIHPSFRRLGVEVLTVLRFLTPDGAERALSLHNDPGVVHLDPRWTQAVWLFIVEGFFHILDGIDHLLFLFCLVIPFRKPRSLLIIVTSFTVAHSITLIASAYGVAPDVLWFPPLVETLIAMSIVYMALENIVSPGLRRRWMITFGFGLVHGFGFSFALRETLQLAGSHVLTSLLAFNIGVEIGQVVVLAAMIPMLELLFRYGVAERMGTIILSALVAHTGWHWLTERGQQLMRYQFQLPAFDASFFLMVVRWLIVLTIAAAAAWLISGLVGRGQAAEDLKSEV
jgi:HupE / UreJ protein